MRVKCIKTDSKICSTRHINEGDVYLAVEISDTDIRVVDTADEPILYPSDWFELIDAIPANWTKASYEDGEYHITPPDLSAQYLFEDYFDDVEYAVTAFQNYLANN